jgi:hypothetical protein
MMIHSSRIFISGMMNTQIQQKLFAIIPKPVFALLILACLVRLIIAGVMVHLSANFYWEYGEIAKNILAGRGYSLYYLSNHDLLFRFNASVSPFPSALMAPGYVGFLLPFMMIKNVVLCTILIIFVQTVLSLLTIVLIYKFTAKYFSQRAALISCFMASILPDFAYSIVSFTPTVLYHVAVLCVLFLLYATLEAYSYTKTLQISAIFAVLSYLRGEFFLFVILFFLLQTVSSKWKNAGIILIITIFLLLPWTIRNYYVFDQFVPLSTGFGLNFYRGNNPEEIGSWGNEQIKRDITALPKDQAFEVRLDRLYRQRAFNFITTHPWQVLSYSPKKLFHLWVFSSLEERSKNYVYEILSGCFFVCSLIGILATYSWQRHRYLYLFLIYSTILALLFFALPRHQTMMKIALVPLAGAGLEFLWSLFTRRRNLETNQYKQPSS